MVGTDIKLVVAGTDGDWFDVLSKQSGLREVNFWSPSARSFKALKKGELFLFKLRAPRNKIVGGGVFIYSNELPLSLAWEAFGVANGANSAMEMRKNIMRYRRSDPNDQSDFKIGCRILINPFFFEESDWIEAPKGWAGNIIYKGYETDTGEGRRLWDDVHDRLGRSYFSNEETTILPQPSPIDPVVADEQQRYGEPHLIRPRLGQGAFRVLITDIYQRRCAVTGEKTLPVLDAAHIRPFSESGSHETHNGLLLRRDIHRLFDLGYVTVTPKDHLFKVSKRLEQDYGNGKIYYGFDDKPINVPVLDAQKPDEKALAWHSNNLYLG